MSIYAVAKKAGVSTTTVSRVINNSGLVSEKTARKVMLVIDEMGYKPNVFAKGLTTNSMRTLGVLTTNICDHYYATAIQKLVNEADDKDYDILLAHTGTDIKDKKKNMNMLLDKHVDGLILVGSVFKESDDNSHIVEVAKKVPVVMINSYVNGDNIYSVCCDDHAGMFEATNYLISKGRCNIVFIYDLETFSALNKIDGYKTAMHEAGLEPLLVKTETNVEGGFSAVDGLLSEEKSVNGIICTTDELAAGALQRLNSAGIGVPSEVAVIGYNDLLIPYCTNPPLASVKVRIVDISEYAFETMFRVLQTGKAPQKIVLMPELVLRKSAEI